MKIRRLLPILLLSCFSFPLAGISNCDDSDADDDGWTVGDGDCDDANAIVHPGAEEVCDGVDNNCDGQVDEGLPLTTYYVDADADGYGTAVAMEACGQPDGYADADGDCDDMNPNTNPGAAEYADSQDNDCDEQVDEGMDRNDGDGDGWAEVAGDCNDGDASVNPGATEICDGIDQDCDNAIDQVFDTDDDGYTTCGGDCNDGDASVNPGATEVCDGIDQDCDTAIDEGVTTTYHIDADGDGYGGSGSTVQACGQPDGYADADGDCNDGDASVNPGATEICDSRDNDCDQQVDEELPLTTYYVDADADGYGDSAAGGVQSCSQLEGYVSQGGDCDDSDASVNPGAEEVCDGVDNNCDGDSDMDIFTITAYYVDADSDGYGDVGEDVVTACEQPAGYSSAGGDCDDADPTAYPGAVEACDGIDNDCDSEVDDGLPVQEYYLDADGDGYGDPNTLSSKTCDQPEGWVLNPYDCNDADASVYPGVTEVCDGKDNDCDNEIDEGVCP